MNSSNNLFYDYQTLDKGVEQMKKTLIECYSKMQTNLVSPIVQPGFLRNQMPQNPPEKGRSIEQIVQQTKNKIYPGTMQWQSPLFYGYFPSSIAVTNVIAEMFAATFHSPAFNYALSPSHTQLQNIQTDWSAIALGLPQKYLLKNEGGGIINGSTTESVFVTVHAAKKRKILELNIQQDNQKVLKFVGYYAQFSHAGAERGLMMKDIFHKRAVPVIFNQKIKNYQLDISKFEQILQNDVKNGLIPFWYGATYGSTLSGAIDLTEQLIKICKKYGIWINVDAAYLGSTWICPQFRPKKQLLQEVDSIAINFSKVLLLGSGGSLLYVGDKKQFTLAFGGTSKFSFYETKYTGKHDVVDYKDWIVGLARRNNGIKFYYLFSHYGLQNLRKVIYQTEQKSKQLQKWVEKDKQLFQLYCSVFGLVCFQVKDRSGQISNELTKQVCDQIKNIQQGFMSPGVFKGKNLIRIVIGNYHSTLQHVEKYYKKIIEKTIELRQKQN